MATLKRHLGHFSLSKGPTNASKDKLSSPKLPRDDVTSEICVICLEHSGQIATSLPCRHNNFHFLCLVTWLQESRACPLCKCEVYGVQYQDDSTSSKQVFNLENSIKGHNPFLTKEGHSASRAQRPIRHSRHWSSVRQSDAETDRALQFRKHIYKHKLYSLYIGSNSVSKYRTVTPHVLSHDERLIAKAKRWIRRELMVFDSLGSDAVSSRERHDRRANNAEFLLSYVITMLKTIEIKGSAGQAEELLQDFLGRENARLFLHELEAFLRSPFESLSGWDNAVQYAIP